MGCDEEKCRFGAHLWAGILLLKNTAFTRSFIKEWLNYCVDPELIKGDMNNVENYPEFAHHQNDESILSILYNKNPHKNITLVPIDKEFKTYFSWHHRHPAKKDISLLPFMGKGIRGVERDFLNSSIIVELRKLFM
ncbi:MAG: hypothetical protein ACTSXG_03525 [Alphaproteobacteria bacterium]